MVPRIFILCFSLSLIVMMKCGGASNATHERPRVITNPDSSERYVIDGLRDGAYTEHLEELGAIVPEGFTIVVQKPFIVIGDEAPEQVRYRAANTIQWAVDMLKNDFFSKDPVDIIDIWLFRDKTSYEKYTRELFNDEPASPFGYYLESENSLLMNISTGGGTLVHEIVHPFMRANFPECPPWFNEGLASLYEQCREEDGHIHGLTNWRLKGLQEAIREERVISFKELTSMNEYQFYREDKGTNYAQARYLCYFLQEENVLVKFYHSFVTNKTDDPTGYQTLQTILDEQDMNAFQMKWQEFVLELTFP